MITTTRPRHVHVEHVLGTVVSLDVRGAEIRLARRATAALVAWLHDVDHRFGSDREETVRWAVQRGAEILRREGLTDFLLTAGADVIARGGALPERVWRVGIQDPRDRLAIAAAISGSDLAVATSVASEPGDSGVLSVTVAGPDLGLAGAYATAALARGIDGPAWTLDLDGYEAMTILAHDQVLLTPGFPEIEAAAA